MFRRRSRGWGTLRVGLCVLHLGHGDQSARLTCDSSLHTATLSNLCGSPKMLSCTISPLLFVLPAANAAPFSRPENQCKKLRQPVNKAVSPPKCRAPCRKGESTRISGIPNGHFRRIHAINPKADRNLRVIRVKVSQTTVLTAFVNLPYSPGLVLSPCPRIA